jgi:hypothetical protein
MMARAALRDASWFDRPDVRKPKRYHVTDGHWFAFCCRWRPLDETTAVELGDVPAGLRCQRRGCRAHWPG